MDRELLRLRRRSHASLLPLCPISPTTAVCDKARGEATQRLSQEHDDQTLTDPDPVARLCRFSHCAAVVCCLHPTGGHGNVLSVHLKSDLYIVGMRVACVTPLIATRADLKHTAAQVVLPLACALRAHASQM